MIVCLTKTNTYESHTVEFKYACCRVVLFNGSVSVFATVLVPPCGKVTWNLLLALSLQAVFLAINLSTEKILISTALQPVMPLVVAPLLFTIPKRVGQQIPVNAVAFFTYSASRLSFDYYV